MLAEMLQIVHSYLPNNEYHWVEERITFLLQPDTDWGEEETDYEHEGGLLREPVGFMLCISDPRVCERDPSGVTVTPCRLDFWFDLTELIHRNRRVVCTINLDENHVQNVNTRDACVIMEAFTALYITEEGGDDTELFAIDPEKRMPASYNRIPTLQQFMVLGQ